MFRETTVYKWDIVTIHSCLLYTILRTLNIFIELLVATNNITSSFVPLNVKGFLVYHHLEKFYTAISSVIDLSNKFVDWKCSGMDGAWWILSDSTISSDFGKYTVIIDDTNFMAGSENYLSGSTRIWPDFTFRKMTFLMVLPTSSTGTWLWCLSL